MYAIAVSEFGLAGLTADRALGDALRNVVPDGVDAVNPEIPITTEGEAMSAITPHDLRELNQRWTEAEIRGDVPALDALTTTDFTLVGPAGFVLDKAQWLDRYRHRDLVTRSSSFEDTMTRVYGATAVTIGHLIQDAEYRGSPASGEFRVTQIAVGDGAHWRLAGLHFSPIARRPLVAQEPVS